MIQAILGHGSIATSQRYVRRASLHRQCAAVATAFGAQDALPWEHDDHGVGDDGLGRRAR